MNSKILLKITGKDLTKFIFKLHKNNIDIEKIKYDKQSIIILVDKFNYKKIKKIKTIYEIKIIRYYGLLYIINKIKNNKLICCCIIVNILLLFLLSNIIFKIEIIHNNKDLIKLLTEELKNYNISRFHLVKTFNYQEKIVENILNKYKDKIEWLEIERIGTKYIVRLEERKIIENKEDNSPKDIVASKNGLVKKVIAKNGEVLVEQNDYVKKGDILIRETIKNKDTVVGKIRANREIYAETWYTATVELPSFYKEEEPTGNENITFKLKLFNNDYILNDKYKFDKEENIFQIKNNLLPISLNIIKAKEIKLKEEIYVENNAISKVINLAEEKINKKLNEEEYIIYRKGLKKSEENSKIIVVIFFKVYENIAKQTDIIEIEE